jgi:iron complex outermembrane receptor protein
MHTEVSNPNKRASLLRLVATGLISMAASMSAMAQAANNQPAAADNQSAQPAVTTTTTTTSEETKKPEEVVVMNEFNVQGSYAGSLEMAAKEKQDSAAIVEVIAPEDIGVLPDVSIADDLARLPGLTSQRVNGRFQDITIRGLSGDFNVGLMDGVEQATTGGNLGDDSRAVEYDQYPSELVGGVEVYKSGQADMVGGIGGTIDIQTVSPLTTDHRVISLSAFYNWTAYGQLTPGVKKAGVSYSAAYIDQFANGTEGIYLGFSHTENPYEGKQFNAWGYPTAPDGNLILGGMRIYDQSELLTRDSFQAVIESKPNDWIHSKLDFFLSYYHDDQPLRGMEIPMAEWGNPTLQPGYTVSNGAITNYTLTNVNPVIRNMDTQWLAHMKSVVWNLDVGEKSTWPVHVSAGYSTARKTEEVLETYAGLGFDNTETDGDTFVVSGGSSSTPPSVQNTVNYSNASLFYLTDPQGWGTGTYPVTGQEGYLKYFTVYDVADSGKVFTTHELNASIFKDVEIGVSYSQRFKQQAQNPSGYLLNADGQPTAPLPPLIGTTDLSWIGNLHPVAFDANAAYNSGLLKFVSNPNLGSWEGDNYKVWEDVTRPFVKFDLKGDVGGVPFDGNLGFVVDAAKQNSNGFAGNTSNTLVVVPVSGGASYADFMPTLNLDFKFTPNDILRVFVGREEQRPDFYAMRAARDYSYDAANYLNTGANGPWSATSGNPSIHPWIANSADLDFEHYFPKGAGYVSVALFEKKLQSYIYDQQTIESFAGYPYTGPTPATFIGTGSQWVNGQGGNITGMEATVQVTSGILTGGVVNGFGIEANGLLVDSSIKPWGPTNASAPLPDMSKKSLNLTLFYEGYGFSARVSDHYQSETREYFVLFGAPTYNSLGTPGDGYSEETPFHTIDAEISYAFKKGPMKGLTLYIEGHNLNNAPQISYNNGDPRQLMDWFKFGASYRTGVTYKF